ncbi:MAG: YbhB/YbcL family Raf kinase inhibitor-like protein [Thermodesulfobacteriota bacterium]
MNGFARAFLSGTLVLLASGGVAQAQQLSVSSPAIKDGDRMQRNLGCEAGEHSPALNVAGVPAEAKTLAVLMTELDAPKGGATLWMAYNIPAAPSVQIAENQPRGRQMKGDGLQLPASGGKPGYSGPCPPPGVTRRYAVEVFALDTALELPETANRQDYLLAIEGHILASGRITGKYKK